MVGLGGVGVPVGIGVGRLIVPVPLTVPFAVICTLPPLPPIMPSPMKPEAEVLMLLKVILL
jgi:hypothetical protein